MTAYTQILERSSSIELARSGHFQAIAYCLNQFLIPQGIYARVSRASRGCLRILVELPPQTPSPVFDAVASRKQQLVRFICHQIWQLNSEAIEGVSIAARPSGGSQILWKQSVRISTPANRQRLPEKQKPKPTFSGVESIRRHYKTLRVLLLTGVAASAFVLGVWFSSQQFFASRTGDRLPSDSLSPSAMLPIVPSAKIKTADPTLDVTVERISAVDRRQLLNPDDPTISLMFAGDVTLPQSDRLRDDRRGIFAAIEEIARADIAAVNLENVLTQASPAPFKTTTYRSAPESVQILADGGIDLVNLANDRVTEYGEAGLNETIETLDGASIHHIGAGRNATEARRPKILEVKGHKIAYLGYYTSDFNAAGEQTAGTNQALKNRIAEDLESLADRVDWTIVNFHWGAHLSQNPASWQIELAHFTIDRGADLIVGHNAKVLQGGEIYQDRAIAYSLGNFIDGSNSEDRHETAVLKVLLKDDRMKVEFLPVEVRDDRPKIVRGWRGRQILRQIEARSEMFDRPMPASAILNRQSNKQSDRQPTQNPPSLPSEVSPSPRTLEISTPADNRQSDPSQPGQQNTPAVPQLMPSSPDDNSDTFIREPFLAPAEDVPIPADRESHLPPVLRLPFETQTVVKGDRLAGESVELPPLVYTPPSWVSQTGDRHV
ncbi:MAG: CapA family protein [Cyanobacteriota bacterium]|nr:CapA family protein [Cyanobacteriota bacterium]